MKKSRYTVETLAAGQPRAYADSRYHYRITIETTGMEGYKNADAPFVPHPKLDKSIVERNIRALTGGWQDDPGPFGRTLKSMTMIEPGVWDVVIIEPYCD